MGDNHQPSSWISRPLLPMHVPATEIYHHLGLCPLNLQVGYDFVMMSTDPSTYTTPPSEGVYIHGLYLEGCGWDPLVKRLCESRPKVGRKRAGLTWWASAGFPPQHAAISVPCTLPGWSLPTHQCSIGQHLPQTVCLASSTQEQGCDHAVCRPDTKCSRRLTSL
jgi:hypothetical protein